MATLEAGVDSTVTGYSDGTLGGSAFGSFTGTLGGATVIAIVTDSTTPNQIDVFTASGSFSAVNGKPLDVDGTIYTQASCTDFGAFVQSTYTATGFSFVNTTVYAVDFAVYAGPTHVGTTLGLGGAGSIAVAFGSTGRAAGDRMFIAVMTANEAVPAVAGWTVVTPDSGTASRGTAGAAGGVRCTVLTRVSDGTETNITIGDSGNIQYAAGIVVRGDSGADVDLGVSIGGNAAASTSGSFTGVTTDGDNQFILTFVATDRDAAAASWSSQANANLGNLTERFDNGTATNTGGGVAIYTGEKLVAGATGATTATQAASAAYCWITLAVKNASGGGGIVGTSSGSIDFTGATAGTVLVKGATSGSIAFTGAATGLATRAVGTASGSLAFTGASAGAVLVNGQGTGSLAFTGASAGTVLVKANASGSVEFTGLAAGVVASSAITGAATGSVAFTGVSTGAVAIQGASSGAFGLAGASTGAVAVQGQGAGSFGLSGASAGTAAQPTIVGAAAGSLAFTGAASGKVQIKGVSSASLSFGGGAAGTVSLPGVVGAAAGAMAFNGFAHNRTSNPTGRMWQPFAQSFAA